MTMTGSLGRLERMDVRDAWPGEASAFTPWLASDENILLLGETIGVDLEVESTERNVGPFRADILCKEKGSPTEHWVLIENQLGRTDHTHLGQRRVQRWMAEGHKGIDIVWHRLDIRGDGDTPGIGNIRRAGCFQFLHC